MGRGRGKSAGPGSRAVLARSGRVGSGQVGSADRADRVRQPGQAFVKLRVADRQRREQFYHLIPRSGGFHEQTALEGGSRYLAGQVRLLEDESISQASTAVVHGTRRHRLLKLGESGPGPVALGQGRRLKHAVPPVFSQGRRASDKGRVNPAERAAVLARLPYVEVGT